MNLTNKQKQYLKKLAHQLKPVVMLGTNGLTEGVMLEIEIALSHHELIKIKIATMERELKQRIINTIIHKTNGVEIQSLGHIVTIYRPTTHPKILLPK